MHCILQQISSTTTKQMQLSLSSLLTSEIRRSDAHQERLSHHRICHPICGRCSTGGEAAQLHICETVSSDEGTLLFCVQLFRRHKRAVQDRLRAACQESPGTVAKEVARSQLSTFSSFYPFAGHAEQTCWVKDIIVEKKNLKGEGGTPAGGRSRH